VVVVDLVMPEMDGATLCRALRARAGASVHLIALTGADPRDPRAAALRDACDVSMDKPFDLATLLAHVQSAVQD
jgi:DNA-binding response OmpR family regulator